MSSEVTATLNYVVPQLGRPRSYMYDPPAGIPKMSASYEPHAVRVRDLRPIASRLSLETEGFRLVTQRSAVRDFYDEDEVRAIYYPEIEQLLIGTVGAKRVVVFDHTVRRRIHDASFQGLRREPVPRVHNDYTVKSGPQRVADLLPAEEAQRLLAGHFSVINLWRPIRGPLEDWPLALCDARSVAASDLIATDLIYEDRLGEIYNIQHSAEHRWFYAPRMSRDEVLLFRCYDSNESGQARFVPHAAFEDPSASPTAIPRESIEARCLVFY